MSPDITLILIQTENFCATLHARRDAGRVINKFVLMRKYFCIMSLMVTGCHHVSMPPHNCSSSHTNNSPTIPRLFKPQQKILSRMFAATRTVCTWCWARSTRTAPPTRAGSGPATSSSRWVNSGANRQVRDVWQCGMVGTILREGCYPMKCLRLD